VQWKEYTVDQGKVASDLDGKIDGNAKAASVRYLKKTFVKVAQKQHNPCFTLLQPGDLYSTPQRV
jgi:hypothetical protein